MTVPPDETITDTHAIIAALRTERDAALAREATLAEVWPRGLPNSPRATANTASASNSRPPR